MAGLGSVFSVIIAYWRNRFGDCTFESNRGFYLQSVLQRWAMQPITNISVEFSMQWPIRFV